MDRIVKKTQRSKVLGEPQVAPITDNIDLSPTILRYGVGFDVHKTTIVTCVKAQVQTGEIILIKTHVFPCNPQGLEDLIRFLQKFHPICHYLMECTGVYHLPLYYHLQAAFPDQLARIIAMNPLLVHRRLSDFGSKTDTVDADHLATLCFYDGLIKPSYVGSVQFMQLREMFRSYYRAQVHCTRLKNRIHRTLHAANQQFPFDFTHEWCIDLLQRYISKEWSLLEAFSAILVDLTLQGKPTKVLEKHKPDLVTFGTIKLTKEQCFLIQMDLMRLLQEERVAATYLKTTESLILADTDFQVQYQNLRLIPSIGSLVALTVLLESGDYHRFSSWKAFVKYCGTTPGIVESGDYKSRGHINHCSNAILRHSLCQAAGVLINCTKGDSDLSLFARRQYLQRGLAYKKAVVKVAQKLAHTIYNVLVTSVPYNSMHETQQRRIMQQQHQLRRKHTLIESNRLRALKRDIQEFFVGNSEFLNSTSRYHLITGFDRVIKKAHWKESKSTEKK